MASTKEDIVYLSDLAPDFDPNKEYDTTDMVAVDGILMHCTSAGRGEAAEFSPANVQDVIDAIDTRFSCSYWYPDGSVRSQDEWTKKWDGTTGIKYDEANRDETHLTVKTLPFCNTGDSASDNSSLSGRVVIPPYVEIGGNVYTVNGVSEFSGQTSSSGSVLEVVAPVTVASIGEQAFAGNTSIVSLYVPSAAEMPRSACSGCTSLSRVTTNNLAVVGENAFSGCSSLVSVSLPSATEIGAGAFYGCTGLRSVYAPLVEQFGDYAFYGCSMLEYVDMGGSPRAEIPPLGQNSFTNVPVNCRFVVPDSQYDDWIAESEEGGSVELEDGWSAVKLGYSPEEIATDGDLVYAYASRNLSVNGVDFVAAPSTGIDNENCTVPITHGASSTPPSEVTPGQYYSLLWRGWYASASSRRFVLRNLSVGHKYLVQIIASRSDYTSQTATSPDGTATIRFGGTDWEYGGALVGVVTADTQTKQFTITYTGNSWINAIQVRDIGGGPPPGHNYWHDLYVAGYVFVKHREWGCARKCDIPESLPNPQPLVISTWTPGGGNIHEEKYDGSSRKDIYHAQNQSLGLVRITDDIDDSSNQNNGVAATPLSVRSVRRSVCDNMFSSSIEYHPEDFVYYASSGGTPLLYRCIKSHKGAWNALDFKQESVTVSMRNSMRYDLVEKTIAEGSVDLDDRAINYVDATNAQSVSLSFPDSVDGKARDFAMVLVCGDTLPTIDYASIITIFAESGDDLVPEKGFNVYSFTEIYGGRFVSSRELVESVVDNSPESTDQLLLAMERAGYPTQGVSSYGGVMQSMGLSDDKTPQDAIDKIYE